jgi:hypothetical protein
MTVEAKVANVISDEEVAFSAGRNQGVAREDVATIYRRIQVPDPDGGGILGYVSRPLLSLLIIEVQDNLSVGRVIQPPTIASVFNMIAPSPRTRVTESTGKESDAHLIVVRKGQRVAIVKPRNAEEDRPASPRLTPRPAARAKKQPG